MQESSSFKQYRALVVSGMTFLVVLGLVLSLGTGMSVSIEAISSNIMGSIPGLLLLVWVWVASRQAKLLPRFRRALPLVEIIGCGILLIFLFPLFHTPPTMMLASLGGPLWDNALARADLALGIHVGALTSWTQDHPSLDWVFNVAYNSIYVQYVIVFTSLLIKSNFRGIWETAAVLIWGSIVGLVAFMVVPAEGPFAFYSLPPNAGQTAYLELFTALRAHEVGRITQGLGVITFPSYHVFFALNLTWAARSIKPVFLFLIALNIVNILSTMTTGWHYFVDVVAGFVLFALALVLVSSVEKRMRTSADS